MLKRHTFIATHNNPDLSSCLFMRKNNQWTRSGARSRVSLHGSSTGGTCAAGSASQGGRATLPGSFGQGPPVSAAGPPLLRAWGLRSPAAGFSGRSAQRSERAPHTGSTSVPRSAGWALLPRGSSVFASLELHCGCCQGAP